MLDVYEIMEVYNPYKRGTVQIVFDNMIADMISKKT